MGDVTGRVLITCAPPNPNGDLHLGHLSGPFLGADVLRRHLAGRGAQVSYVAYTDDHSCYVPRRGAELGWTPRETALRFTRRIEQTLALADMSPDYYAHPAREPRHDEQVQQQFLRLRERGAVVERVMPTPWCRTCECFVYEAYLRGRCHFCALPCDGTYCEDCGLPQDPEGVREGRCITCGEEPVWRDSRRWVVPLSPYADRLAALYADAPWSRRVLDYCEKLLATGLPDVPVSRVYGYGIPVPVAGSQGQILDTWFSGIFGYQAATLGYTAALGRPDEGREIWSDPSTTLVNFIGFDCSFSHAVLWPALLIALDSPVLPRHILSNEFYHLEGGKFSTSRGHAIWGADFLREVPSDAARFHLCLTRPETTTADFRRVEFDHTLRQILAGDLDGWAGSVLDTLADTTQGVVPDVAATDLPPELRGLTLRLIDDVGAALDPAGFSVRDAAAAVSETVRRAAADATSLRAGADPAGRQAALAAHLELMAAMSAVAAPLLPNWSRRVRTQLGLPAPVGEEVPPWPVPGTSSLTGHRVSTRYQPMFGCP